MCSPQHRIFICLLIFLRNRNAPSNTGTWPHCKDVPRHPDPSRLLPWPCLDSTSERGRGRAPSPGFLGPVTGQGKERTDTCRSAIPGQGQGFLVTREQLLLTTCSLMDSSDMPRNSRARDKRRQPSSSLPSEGRYALTTTTHKCEGGTGHTLKLSLGFMF